MPKLTLIRSSTNVSRDDAAWMEEALELADRVAILNQGKVEQVGKPDEVYDNPATAFVMFFVGDTTSIPVEFDGVRLSNSTPEDRTARRCHLGRRDS